MDRGSRPFGRLPQGEADGACSLLTTITLLGERQVIIDLKRRS